MDVGLRYEIRDYSKVGNISVSILVLMDVGLRSDRLTNRAKTQIGFNPCFNGCRSAIRHSQSSVSISVAFQSLF